MNDVIFPLKFINLPERDDTSRCCQSDSIFDFKIPPMYLTESITLQYGVSVGKLKETVLQYGLSVGKLKDTVLQYGLSVGKLKETVLQYGLSVGKLKETVLLVHG